MNVYFLDCSSYTAGQAGSTALACCIKWLMKVPVLEDHFCYFNENLVVSCLQPVWELLQSFLTPVKVITFVCGELTHFSKFLLSFLLLLTRSETIKSVKSWESEVESFSELKLKTSGVNQSRIIAMAWKVKDSSSNIEFMTHDFGCFTFFFVKLTCPRFYFTLLATLHS